MPLNELFAKTPKGKNSISSTAQLYDEKDFYYNNVYPDGDLPWIEKPFDFINENPLYGKVNLNGDYIIPKYELIAGKTQYKRVVEVDTKLHGVKAFDFVVEAFNDLKANIESLVKARYLSAEGAIAKFDAKKGLTDFEVMNKLQKEVHYFMFVSEFLTSASAVDSNFTYKELLHNISDFTNFFISYLNTHTKTMPFTKGGIANAFYMAPMSTGLCLEIDDRPYDDDQKKHEFLKDPNFNLYRILARRFGFMIDRNVPWRLVADVQSFKMREYMRLAYERETILERQKIVLEMVGEEITKQYPDLVKNNLQEVLTIVSEETKDFWMFEDMYAAKDPLKNNEGINVCTGDTNKTCTSRIFKFDKFFEVYYDVPYLSEIEDIKNTFYKFYLSYYVQNPIVKKRVLCSDTKNLQTKFIIKETNLELMDEKQYNNLYSDYYWLKVYFDIKLAESNIKFKPAVYNDHIKKIMDLSTLNFGSEDQLAGTTSKNFGHVHEYSVDADGNGWAAEAVHPDNPSIKHSHEIVKNFVQPAQSSCYPYCWEKGSPSHIHIINNDILLALNYINKIVRKKMKGSGQIYGDKGKKKEQLIGQMLLGATQKGMISY